MKYRIKQIEENKFLPQVKTWFLGSWKSIDKEDFYLWTAKRHRKFCICSTLREAKDVINDYKWYLEYRKDTIAATAKKMFYPKYHKV